MGHHLVEICPAVTTFHSGYDLPLVEGIFEDPPPKKNGVLAPQNCSYNISILGYQWNI